jgi:putative redox protein
LLISNKTKNMTSASIASSKYRLALNNGRHEFYADEPQKQGGTDTAPAPDELLEASLASCTAITLRMYADRKQWPVETIEVKVRLERMEGKTLFTKTIHITGNIDEAQHQRMLQIAEACPVSKTLLGNIEIKASMD